LAHIIGVLDLVTKVPQILGVSNLVTSVPRVLGVLVAMISRILKRVLDLVTIMT
jgi:hypothetical protein